MKHLHCVEGANEDKSKSAIGVIARPRDQPNRLSYWGGRAESKDQQPRTDGFLGVRHGSNTGAQSKAFEALVEENGNEQDNEALRLDGDRHADENRVEENTAFQESNIE